MPPPSQQSSQQQSSQSQHSPEHSANDNSSSDFSNNNNNNESNNNSDNNNTRQRPQVVSQTIDLFVYDHPVFGPIPGAPPPGMNPGGPGMVAGPTLYVHFDGQTLHLSDTPSTDAQMTAEAAQRQQQQQQQQDSESRQDQQQRPYNLRPRTAAQIPPEMERMFMEMFGGDGPPGRRRARSRAGGQARTADNLVALLVDILMVGGLMGGGPHLQGQPPASAEAKSNLQRLQFITQHQISQCPKCLVCLEEFPVDGQSTPQEGDECVRQMPCKHLFHQACIFKWLENSNQCPTCRYEIMTDNGDYNSSIKERMAQRDAEILLEEERHLQQQQSSIDQKQPAVETRDDPAAAIPVSAANNIDKTNTLANGQNRKRSHSSAAGSSANDDSAPSKHPRIGRRNRRTTIQPSNTHLLSSTSTTTTTTTTSSNNTNTPECRYPLRNRNRTQ